MSRHDHRARTLRSATSVAAVGLLLAACSTTSKSDNKPSGGGTGGNGGTSSSAWKPPAVTAEAPGVTANSIKIGYIYYDLTKVRKLGIDIDNGDPRGNFLALVDDLNRKGGINGRKIEAVYAPNDPMTSTSATAGCVKLTQDDKVFAVLGPATEAESPCYLQTHKTAFIGGDMTRALYAAAKAPWFTNSYFEGLADGIKVLVDKGVFAGKKVALLALNGEQGIFNSSVKPTLKDANIPVVSDVVLNADTTDTAAVNSQLKVFARKFQDAGADVVVVNAAATLMAGFVAQGTWRPTLVFGNIDQANSFTANPLNKTLFGVLKGAKALGPAGDFNSPTARGCLNVIEKADPKLKGKLVDPTQTPPGQPTYGATAALACRLLSILTAILKKAGRDLNYKTFEQAGLNLGTLRIPTYADPAKYTTDTPYGALPPRVYEWNPTTRTFVLSK